MQTLMPKPTSPRSSAFKAPAARKPGVRELAAQATRDSLLRAATKVFAKHGLSGASVEKISKAAKSYDRMIYYYFGSKEGLFVAVLEETYRRFNEAEAALVLDPERPVESLLAVTRFVMAYYRNNPEFAPARWSSATSACCCRATSTGRSSTPTPSSSTTAASPRSAARPTATPPRPTTHRRPRHLRLRRG
jgi:AcrR family transcriptional regulator